MKIVTAGSTNSDTKSALKECFKSAGIRPDYYPDWLLIYYSDQYDSKSLLRYIAINYPLMTVMGGSSCLGVMTRQGFISDDGVGLGVFGIYDPHGSYGTGICEIGDDPELSARNAVESALTQSGRLGELPEMVWLTAAPGTEESLIKGIEAVIGSNVPIAGGSAADNSVSGNWTQFAGSKLCTNGVAVSLLFPSGELTHSFHSGYDPTDKSGLVTAVTGRIVKSIDHQPAAEVLQNWTNIFSEKILRSGGNILADTTMHPLGREVASVGTIPFFKLSHPHEILDNGSVSFFTEINKGDRLVQMTGSTASLISRAGRVVQSAISAGDLDTTDIAGVLIVFCAGCMLTVKDDMEKVVSTIGNVLGDVPFLGAFTFGEQGCFVGHENSHGNLMISVVCFGRDEE